MILHKLLFIISAVFLLGLPGKLMATVHLVENTLNSGDGSLRNVIDGAADGDTVLINIKGTISLEAPIEINERGALTIIGPYPKHNTITSVDGWSGNLFHINNSGPILMRGLGFVGGNGTTRHIQIENCTERISIERCLFHNNSVVASGIDGGAIQTTASLISLSSCSFIGNKAVRGGALSLEGSSKAAITNCTFSGNEATDKAGAIIATGGTEADFFYNTFVKNEAVNIPEALRFQGASTAINMENNAIANNGDGRQIQRLGGATISSYGGNCIQQNYVGEPTSIPVLVSGDYINISLLFTLGLRSEIKTDGFGLMYWPIVDGNSTLNNRAVPTARTPGFDARNAPRSLKGEGLHAWPDAGACEYTHLRVTNTSGSSETSNSFLWALSSGERKDATHYVEFDIPDVPGEISFESEGIASTNAYIIDGYSQEGSAIPGPHQTGIPGLTRALILIDFINGGTHDHGIRFNVGSNHSILQGVSVQAFSEHGIESNVNNVSIFGCESGINDAGDGNGNLRTGIKLKSSGNIVGGWEHWMRNVVSGNGLDADPEKSNIHIQTGNNNSIQGNIIGGAPNGLSHISAPDRTRFGIKIQSAFNQVGGTLVNTGNIIGDNEYGIYMYPAGDNTVIAGNKIGIGWDGLTAQGNSEDGLFLSGSDRAKIGGENPKAANIIAHNQGAGISMRTHLTPALDNSILGNSIHSNLGQGIDLENDGIVVANDGIVSSFQQNHGLDYPELVYSDNCDGTQTTTSYLLKVPTGQDYRVEFFTVTSPDPTNGEGEVFIGHQTVSVTSNPETFTFDHGILLTPGTTVSATATQISNGSTSEFGINSIVTAPAGDPTISYLNICHGDTARPDPGYEAGGEFRFAAPEPPPGVTIDVVTGYVAGGEEGETYTVIYNLGGTCVNEDTAEFKVIDVNEGFVFEDFCPGTNGEPGTINTPGGDFYLDPDPADGAGITIDTGILTGGIEGTTYSIKYVAEGLMGCKDSSTVTAQIIPTDESFTMEDFCPITASAPAEAVTEGGDFSFDPAPMDGASINTSTGAITGGVEGNTYTVKYTVGTCSEEYSLDVATIVADESFTFDDFCPGNTGSPTDVVIEGGFSFLTDPGDGASINAGTGDITFGVEGTTYEILHTVGVCLDKDTAYPKVISIAETFTYPDFCIAGDSSVTHPIIDIAADPDSSFFILLDPVDDETINLETGIIYSPAEGQTYNVVDSTRNQGCWQTDTVAVTAIEVNEAFSFPDICAGETGEPIVELDLVDTFFFATDPMDGAEIEPYDGTLTNGAGGETYTLKRIAFLGSCSDTATTTVTIIAPDASFTYTDFCPGLPSIEPEPATEDGVFSFETSPLYGETMDGNGVIHGAYEDSLYSVVYTVEEEGCTASDTVEVHVHVVNEGFSHSDFCWGAASGAAVPLEPAGTYAFGTPAPDDGATIDPETGVVENATEGTVYEIVHTLTSADGCTQSDSLLITTLGVDESFTFEDFCPGEESTVPEATTPDGTFDFNEDPDDGASIDPDSGIITGPVEGHSYEIIYTVDDETGECSESSVETVSVIATNESFSFDNFCAESVGVPTAVITTGGTFSFAPPIDDAVIDPETGAISMGEPGTSYPVQYEVGECMERDTNYVMALVSDNADFNLDDHCANVSLEAEITGTTGGQFDFDTEPGDGTTINSVNGILMASPGGEYQISYRTEGSATTCADTIVKTVTLYAVPEITDIYSQTDLYCPYSEIQPINAVSEDAGKLYWYKSSTGDDIVDSSFSYTPEALNTGKNLFFIRPYSTEGCYGEFKSYTVYLSDTAGMRAISDFDICLGSPANLEAYGGASYEWTTEVPLADYTSYTPVAFSLNEEIYTVSIKNEDDCEVIDSVHVGFLPRTECSIDVYNAFSPNDDGKNDFWYIENLINYIPNTVYIYNRWGDEILKIPNYDNITTYWDGKDKNGNNLPPNTYFYVVITDDTNQNQAGWVQIVR